jgi:hypothetical protein
MEVPATVVCGEGAPKVAMKFLRADAVSCTSSKLIAWCRPEGTP